MVDDSAVVQHLLRSVIDGEPDMVVVGTAHDGESALALVEKLRPDLVSMDVCMPGDSGIAATQRIMAVCPTPIAIVTAAPATPDSQLTFDALSAGAVDVIVKPTRAIADDPVRRHAFLRQLRSVAGVRVVGIRTGGSAVRPVSSSRPPAHASAPIPRPPAPAAPLLSISDVRRTRASLIAIGASTGGPPCVRTLLGALHPTDAPPVVLTQHMGRDFVPGFVRWLDEAVGVRVMIARPGLVAKKGHAYVAPGDRHLCIDSGGVLWLSDAPSVNHQRPSVDVLFESIASDCPPGVVGILLTGMGADGARGLSALRHAGALTVAQDEASSVVFGMPKAAVEIGAAEAMGDPPAIAQLLGRLKSSPLISTNAGDERRGGPW